MKTKYIITIIAFLLISNVFAQSNLNDYKYVIVPKKYDFFKSADQYQVNSLTKFLLEKENFKVFFNDNLPEDLSKNRCLGLYANILENKSMFKTKLIVELKDCNNKTVFKSKEGASKEKDYKKSYHEALRDAFNSFKGINYKYQPKKVEQEIVLVKTPKTPKVEKPIINEVPKQQVIIEQKVVKPVIKETPASNILYAQSIGNGFQVVDSTPKVVMILISTPKQNVFIVKGQDAIVYEQDGFWYLAKNDMSVETLNIKF